MSRHTIYTQFRTGDPISERAARRATAHPRTAAAPAPEVTPASPMNPAPAAHQPTPTLASGPRMLRRWSVAELVYRAAARPPVLA